MSATEFTPAALEVSEYRTTDEFRAILAHVAIAKVGTGDLIAVTGPAGDENAIAYAKLFRAAPDLYAVVEAVCKVLGETDMGPDHPLEAVYQAALSARDKARGGQ